MTLEHDVPLAPSTTLRIGGPARLLVRAASVEQAAEALAYARRHDLRVFVLGGGSNLVVPDEGFAGLVLQLAFPAAIESVATDTLAVSAGTDWDLLVRTTAERGLAGMECLAGIPGLVGASPIQNIGAYGQEAAQTIVSIRAIDRSSADFAERELPAAACEFAYRRSLFNSTGRDRYLVTAVSFRLLPGGAPRLDYADLAPLRAGKPTLLDVYDFVRQIRARKGMLIDPLHPNPDTRSACSFFKNPLVAPGVRERIAATLGMPLEQVPGWPAGDQVKLPAGDRVKLPAAWLIERAGFPKGYAPDADSPVAISTRHTLALVNRSGTATCADLLALRDRICAGVERCFGVMLEQEPVLLA